MNLRISSQLLRTHPSEVNFAHITATEYELQFAKEANDFNWIHSRITDVNSWMEDEEMPQELKS